MIIKELPTVLSTNDYVKAHCDEFTDMTVVYTQNQTQGKGRRGRAWQDNGKGLAMSLLLKGGELSLALPLFIGFVVREALTELLDDTTVNLKWPNDVICSGKKIGGILCESVVRSEGRCYICGIGINLTMAKEDFMAAGLLDATSLLAGSQAIYPAEVVVKEFCRVFEKYYPLFYRNGFAPFVEEYDDYCLTTGRDVEIQKGEEKIVAFAMGISEDGRLIVQNGEGTFLVDAGDVSIRGTEGYV